MTDTWLYLGAAAQPEFWATHVSNVYWWTRYAWTLPGIALFKMLDPVAANLAWHALFVYGAAVAVFLWARPLAGPAVALIGVATLVLDRWVQVSLGWHYVDGAGAAYLLAASACVTAGARSRRSSLLLLGGAFAGLTTNLNPVAAPLAPCVALPPIVYHGWRRARDAGGVAKELALCTMGAALTWAVLAGVHFAWTGSIDIATPNIEIARFVQVNGALQLPSLSEKLWRYGTDAQYRWLDLDIMPVLLVTALTLADLARRQRPSELAILASGGGALALLLAAVYEVTGRTAIYYMMHFTYWQPFATLAIAALAEHTVRQGVRAPLLAAGIVAAALLVMLIDVVQGDWLGSAVQHRCADSLQNTCLQEGSAVLPLVGSVATWALGAVWLWLAVRRGRARSSRHGTLLAASLALAISAGLLVRGDVSRRLGWRAPWQDRQDAQHHLLAVVQAGAWVRGVFPEGVVGFAFQDRLSDRFLDTLSLPIGTSFGAHRWYLTDHLPEITCPDGPPRPIERQVVIMGPDPSIRAVGEAALARCGLALRPVAEMGLTSGRFRYYLFAFRGERPG